MRLPVCIAVLGLILALLFVVGGSGDGSVPAAAAGAVQEWRFAIGAPEDVPRSDATVPMYAFLFDVDAAGRPDLERSWRLRGEPPRFREHPDFGRVYRWTLEDASGATLATGRHFDKLAMYVPDPEGGCDKHLIGDHAMMIRTPAPEAATTLILTIESSRTDEEAGR